MAQRGLPQYLTHANVAKLTPIFRFCFHADPTPERTNSVMAVLWTISRALNVPFAVKVIEMNGGTAGYVKLYYTGCVQRTMGVYQYMDDDSLIHRRGEIHLDKATLACVSTK